MTRSLFLLLAICFSTTAFAESAQPKVGNKPLVQAKPRIRWAASLLERSEAQSYGLATRSLRAELIQGGVPIDRPVIPEPEISP
jgi:hypothetical protein